MASSTCMKLYRCRHGIVAEHEDHFYTVNASSWDEVVTREDLADYLHHAIRGMTPLDGPAPQDLLAPIGSQEVWAAGVTYYRSRNARMEESSSAGGGDFYDRVYQAARPELFFKSMPHRVAGPGAKAAGYTIGNDMSSRDIEGENPLYLPQAKVYDRSCALGPCLLICDEQPSAATEITLEIRRGGAAVFSGATTLKEMKRAIKELVEYLYRNNSFPQGCFLLTGTGVVPPDRFTLQ